MTQSSVKNFKIKNEVAQGVLNEILDLSVNFLTLMACLGQTEYAGDDFATVADFERNPQNYLTKNDKNKMKWKKTPDRLKQYNGVGMKIPKNTLIILDSNILYPVIYLKEKSDTQYGVASKFTTPTIEDKDNIFIVGEESLDMAVIQNVSKYVRRDLNNTRIQKLEESVKVEQTYLFSEFLGLLNITGGSPAQELKAAQGHRMTTIIEQNPEDHTVEKYLQLDYYDCYDYTQPDGLNPDSSFEKGGKLIIMMPYISARHDMLGQLSFGDTDPAIILTTT
ncbi:hypothetical protein [uncultured Microscilla sp.]|uniref:hypothetical protein n=1 Tax=uncultured Microscilla sp. TaxID=432653 RepID=UPI00262E6FCB|nr:hypothetical protein [uncultured Microscilla sp.]